MGTPTWLSATPVALVAAFWVIVPGLLVTRVAGVRGITAWAAAPMLSMALIAGSAVAGTAVGVPWGPWTPLVAALLVAAACGVYRGLLARRPAGSRLYHGWRAALRTWGPGRRIRSALVRLRTPRGLFASAPEEATTALPRVWRNSALRDGPDGRRAGLLGLAGTSLACALAWLTTVRGFGPVDQLSSTYDAVFHYNAVAHILDTGDASSLTLGTLTDPAAASAFYPGGWHDLVSLVAMTSGAGVPVATNITAWAVAALVFPLSVLLLTRTVLGRSAGAAFAAPVLATAFTGFPWALMSFGVLWPNLLGIALLPAALAVVAVLSGTVRDPVLRPGGALALAVPALLALGFAHPNAVFSIAVLGVFPILFGLARLTRLRLRTRQVWQPLLGLAGTLGATALVVWLMVASPLLEGVRNFDWPAFTSTPVAVSQVLLLSTNGRPALWPVAVLVLVGAVASLRRLATSWLVPAHLASGFLYVLAASREDALTAGLTGAWYNDSFRLAAMLPVTGAVLAVLGIGTLAGAVRRVLLAAREPVAGLVRRRGAPAVLVAVCTLALVLGYGGLRVGVHALVLSGTYQDPADIMLDPGQREFLAEVAAVVPPDAVVAADPFTGNALLYPLTGRRVLFPHLIGNWTPDQLTVASRLRDAGTDPAVCAAAAATGVGYVISGPITFWPSHGGARWYPGLHDIAPVPGFELVATGAGQELWRLTACDPTTAAPAGAGTGTAGRDAGPRPRTMTPVP